MRSGSAQRLALVGVWVILAAGLWAQATDGNLTGVVTDGSGALVSGAAIELTNEGTGVKHGAVSDAIGVYRFRNIPVGAYRLTAWLTGFQSATIRNVAVQLNKTSTSNVTLEVAGQSTSVSVTDSAALVDTTTSQIQSAYDARQARELPVTGIGNLGVINMSLLAAGVSSPGGIGFGTGPSVGGQRPSNNNFMVDGVDNNNRALTGPVMPVSNEAVAEFSLLQNQFTSEFGHSSGGQFNTVVKSGTNQIHGSVYEYFQNRNLNAIDESFKRQGIRSQPRYDQNRVGGNIGGPAIREKLFYFFNYEYNPQGQSATNAGTVSVPTAGGYRILDGLGGISKANLDQFKKYVPAAASASNRFATVLGTQVPLGILSVAAPRFENVHHAVSSADWNVSNRDQIRARYLYRGSDSIDTNANLPHFFTPFEIRSHLASLGHFHTFSPALTNELRVAYTRYHSDYRVDGFSYPGLDAFPNLSFRELGLNVGPFFFLPQTDRSNTYQLVNNVNWIMGRNSLKFGYDGRKVNRSNFFVQRSRGDYQYNTLERFLLDVTPEFAVRSVGAIPFAGNLLSHYAYVSNEFRIRPNLTLTNGFRFEWVDVPAGAKLQALNSISSVPGLVDFRAPRASRGDLAPRIGLAWSPGNSGRTAIRAGFGVAYDQFYQNMGVLSLPPQFSTTADAHITRANQPNFLANGGIANRFAPVTNPATARASTSAFIPDQQRPYSVQWTLGVQHGFAHDYTVEVRYLGTRGIHLPQQVQLNRRALVGSEEATQLPVFLQRPSDAQIDALRTTMADVMSFNTNTWAAQGFGATVLGFMPQGNSTYHGLALQLNRRFSNGFQLISGYTWSHNIDDGTTVVSSTLITPRRAQDFNNLRAEKSSSALDHRHRLTVSWTYETPWFRQSKWAAKNLIGNWALSGTYTAETGGYATALSGVDSNINGDNFADRTIVNPAGQANVGSGVRALCRGGGICNPNVAADRSRIVGWVADNPNARYILAGQGSYPNGGRNTLQMPGINNFDLAISKRISVTESKTIEFRSEAYNAFNVAQYTPGFTNSAGFRPRVNFSDFTMLLPGQQGASNAPGVANPLFARPDQAFQSNSRTLQLVLRFRF
ncbi:MAG: TonB-dependent receptor [Acidobacteria bacterium]|nr:TonB-dependent receptor [Acidobacteriota bacterium]